MTTYRDPLYIAIADLISEKIIKEELVNGIRIETPKEWAEKTGLNPNAVEKGYQILFDRHILTFTDIDTVCLHPQGHENAIKYRKEKFLQKDLIDVYKMFHILNGTPEELAKSYIQYLNSI